MVASSMRFHPIRSCKPWLIFATGAIPRTDGLNGVEHLSIGLNQQNLAEVKCLRIGVANPSGEAWPFYIHEYTIASSSCGINYVYSISTQVYFGFLLAPAHPLQSTIATSIIRRPDLHIKAM